MYKRTKLINYFGCPASGKTTAAFEKCAELKKQGYTVYFASEFATDMILDRKYESLKNQRYLFVNQAKRLLRAYNKVDYVVTDCPILLNIVYARFNENSDPKLEKEIIKLHESFENENYFLPFNGYNYKQENRVHTAEQALVIDGMIRQVFKDCGMVYCETCKKVSDKPIQYGKLILDYCQNCRG